MTTKPQRQKRRDGVLSSLNAAIEAINLAKEVSSVTPAKAVFGTASVLLTMIRDSMSNEIDYIELGLACADVCKALDRGMNGRRVDEFSHPVCEAIEQLTKTVEEIHGNVTEKRGRSSISRLAHAKGDKEAVAAWRSDLNRLLHVFNTELAINNHVMLSDIHHNVMSAGHGGADGQRRSTQARPVVSDTMEPTTLPSHNISSGESPPPPPRVCFGRDELIKKIVGLAENLTPIALIGAGGIGKTSIALTALHDNRTKQRFGDNRRFIRCDQFPASHTHFLRRLSTVIGAGVENPEDLTPLRPFLSSKEMFIIIDNAESILDPQGTSAQEIYTVVEELSQFNNICLCITTRISTIPPDCETLRIPTLPMEAARDAFYRIYKNGERSDQINNILERLDFHPLSVTLLATVAHHNTWDTDRLAREWDQHRTGVLKTEHNKSLAATIELSLSSPMFQKLGPNARDLLGVIAFFPQGIDENNLNWLFPTVSDRTSIFDKFCILSLTYRAGGFVTMLAPLRDYLCPKHPQSSSLLCTTKDCYFDRLSVDVQPGEPGFEEARWIMSEDANVEHLLDVFISIDPGAADIWDACYCFMEHIRWHKKRLVVLGPKIEGLPDDHHAKPQCLSQLSRLFQLVGNHVEEKRLLICALKLWMERGIDFKVAETLRSLSDTNRSLRLYEEGIPQAKEALEIYERLNIIPGQARSLQHLAQLLCNVGQLEAAEEAASRALRLLLEGQCHKYLVCQCHRALGSIYLSKGEMEKAKNQLEAALKIASSFNWPAEQFWNHYGLAELVSRQGRFDDAHAHIERAKSYTADNAYHLGRAMKLQAHLRYIQCQPKEARTETLRAIDVFEKLGDTRNVENCRLFLRFIPAGTDIPVTSNDSGLNAWEQSDGTDDSSLDTFRAISSV